MAESVLKQSYSTPFTPIGHLPRFSDENVAKSSLKPYRIKLMQQLRMYATVCISQIGLKIVMQKMMNFTEKSFFSFKQKNCRI